MRWLAMVVPLSTMAALPASAGAALEFNLPAQIFKVFDESGKSAVDPHRCDAIVFLEFPKLTHAVSYRIVVRDQRDGSLDDHVAPRHFRPWRVTPHGNYEVRTDTAVLSARG